MKRRQNGEQVLRWAAAGFLEAELKKKAATKIYEERDNPVAQFQPMV
nr:hypothetical protein [Kyrpidia spormannii]